MPGSGDVSAAAGPEGPALPHEVSVDIARADSAAALDALSRATLVTPLSSQIILAGEESREPLVSLGQVIVATKRGSNHDVKRVLSQADRVAQSTKSGPPPPPTPVILLQNGVDAASDLRETDEEKLRWEHKHNLSPAIALVDTIINAILGDFQLHFRSRIESDHRSKASRRSMWCRICYVFATFV